jgi:hypothetical protein
MALVGSVLRPAYAGEVQKPVCAERRVLDQVADMLRQAGRPMRLQTASVGELSPGTERLVHCAVRGQMLGYDTIHHGMQPLDALFVVRYALELRQNGIFLRLE